MHPPSLSADTIPERLLCARCSSESLAVAPCACVPGVVPPSTLQAVEGGNSAFAEDGPLLRALDLVSDDCGRRLWRERRSAHRLLVQVFAEHSIDGRLLSVLTEPLLKAVVKEAPRAVACIIAERDNVLKQYQQ